MTRANVESLVRAVLYEGYVLYPYRASSVKNRQRFTFGTLYPPAWCDREPSDAFRLQTEVLVEGEHAGIEASARFLELVLPREGWHEAEERESAVPTLAIRDLVLRPHAIELAIGHLRGRTTVSATRLEHGLFRVRIVVENMTPLEGATTRDDVLLSAFASTHVVLTVHDGAFVSLLDPPEARREAAAACVNEGAWPVLVGAEGERSTMLASPIILYDYPRVARESPGDLFDATEIDEILTLRILTLTEEEKRAARQTDPRARALLDRTEALEPRELLRLHGAMRSPLREGDRVRISPRHRADAMDVILRGRVATVRSLEQDVDGRRFACVTIDDDPGQDLGLTGQPGHRFFFGVDELERLE